MLRVQRSVRSTALFVVRKFSDEAKKPVAITAPAAPVASKSSSSSGGGSTFFQRFASFLAGCGVGFGVSFYFLYNELVDSNENLLRTIKQLEGPKGK